MDPDVCLAELRDLLARFNPDDAPGENVDNDDIAWDICERVAALDGWLSKGGFFPAAWTSDPLQNATRI